MINRRAINNYHFRLVGLASQPAIKELRNLLYYYVNFQAIRKGLEDGPNAGYIAEAEGFAELGMTSESKALKSLFFGQVSTCSSTMCYNGFLPFHLIAILQTECKKNRFGKPSRETKNLAVLGAGLMGAGIVQVSLQKGYDVIMKDNQEKGLTNGYDYVYKG